MTKYLLKYPSILTCIPVFYALSGCFSTKQTVKEEELLKGSYLLASKDTGIYGVYVGGRSLIFIQLKPDSVYEMSYYSRTISPKYERAGKYRISEDSLFMKDTFMIAEKDMQGRYSLWYSGDSSLRNHTLFFIRYGDLRFIDYRKQNDSINRMLPIILSLPSEDVKMDMLPFRKMDQQMPVKR